MIQHWIPSSYNTHGTMGSLCKLEIHTERHGGVHIQRHYVSNGSEISHKTTPYQTSCKTNQSLLSYFKLCVNKQTERLTDLAILTGSSKNAISLKTVDNSSCHSSSHELWAGMVNDMSCSPPVNSLQCNGLAGEQGITGSHACPGLTSQWKTCYWNLPQGKAIC